MKNLLILAALVLGMNAAFAQKTVSVNLCGDYGTIHFGYDYTQIKPIANGIEYPWFKIISNTYDGNLRTIKYYNSDSNLVTLVFADNDKSAAFAVNGTIMCGGYWYNLRDNNY